MKINFKSFPVRLGLFLISILLLINTYSCSCSCGDKKQNVELPIDILKKADSFIKSKTGDEFFAKYVTPDFQLTKHTPPNYEIVYNLYIPEKSYVNGLIKFTVDSTGKVLTNRDIIGIPNCYRSAEECEFNVDEKQAIQIARENGLEQGIKEWKIDFLWSPQKDRYVWHIVSTFQEIEGDIGYRADGKEAFINPATGDVIEINNWRVN